MQLTQTVAEYIAQAIERGRHAGATERRAAWMNASVTTSGNTTPGRRTRSAGTRRLTGARLFSGVNVSSDVYRRGDERARFTGQLNPKARGETQMAETTAVIVNLTTQSWTLHRSYGTFTVRGCATRRRSGGSAIAARQAKTPAHDAVHDDVRVTRKPRTAVMDLGDKRTLEVPISAYEVGEDLCREINADGGDDSYFGVFVAVGEKPTDEELAQSRLRLMAFYRRLVAAADREWERSHSYLFINDVERRAALYLGVEKEWFYQPRETVECPGCGEKIKPGFAVCKTCGAILDRAKAAALGLIPPAAPSGHWRLQPGVAAGVAANANREAKRPVTAAGPVRARRARLGKWLSVRAARLADVAGGRNWAAAHMQEAALGRVTAQSELAAGDSAGTPREDANGGSRDVRRISSSDHKMCDAGAGVQAALCTGCCGLRGRGRRTSFRGGDGTR